MTGVVREIYRGFGVECHWRIDGVPLNHVMYPDAWSFVHPEFDGAPDAGDNRCGCGRTRADCLEQIDEILDEECPR